MNIEELCSHLIRSPHRQKEFSTYANLYKEELAKFKAEKERQKHCTFVEIDTVGKYNCSKIQNENSASSKPRHFENSNIIINPSINLNLNLDPNVTLLQNNNHNGLLIPNDNIDMNHHQEKNILFLNLENQAKSYLNQSVNDSINKNSEILERAEISENVENLVNLDNKKQIKNQKNGNEEISVIIGKCDNVFVKENDDLKNYNYSNSKSIAFEESDINNYNNNLNIKMDHQSPDSLDK